MEALDRPLRQPKILERLASLDDAGFVRLCYRAILDRSPDSAGFLTHLAALSDGAPRESVIDAMVDSREFIERDPDRKSIPGRVRFLLEGGFLDTSLPDTLNRVASLVNR